MRFTKRTVKVTETHTEEVKKLLKLMGVPFVSVILISLNYYI